MTASEYALDTLYCHLNGVDPIVEFDEDFEAPMFVTWNKNGDLRGCIGTFMPQKVKKGIARYALVAALEDHRFPPIGKKEFKNLECHVTILKDFKDISSNPYDWEIGVHGIELELLDRGLSATFLPSVMEEQGWDKDDTFLYLIRKAGTRGQLEDFKYKVTRYTGDKSIALAKDYIKMRGES